MTKEEKREYQKCWRKNHTEKMKQYDDARREYSRKYAKTYKNNHPEYQKNWRKHNPDIMFKYHLKNNYKITPDEYNDKLNSQNECCAICGKSSKEYKRRLHVDHNHTTGQFRGLLCVKCNSGIGCFNEDISLIDKVKKYLKHYSRV
jgi:YesN/AraC family two-component response regulator